MKPGGPWNLRGLRPETVEAAREAARRSGMSVGEWLNNVIRQRDDYRRATMQFDYADEDPYGWRDEALADEVCAFMDSLAEVAPGCDAFPVWLKRHHKTDATIASTIVVVSAIQNAQR